MIGWLIVICEIGFWVFILAGLFTRYILKQKRIGAVLLWCSPLVDLVLIIATIVDLKNGADATFVHGLAAYYIGISIAFGHRMIQWADERFSYKFSNGPKPKQKPKYGLEKATAERQGWYRHLLAWGIGNVLLLLIIIMVGDKGSTVQLYEIMKIWLVVLIIDFLISFSYTVFPKK